MKYIRAARLISRDRIIDPVLGEKEAAMVLEVQYRGGVIEALTDDEELPFRRFSPGGGVLIANRPVLLRIGAWLARYVRIEARHLYWLYGVLTAVMATAIVWTFVHTM